MKTKFLIPILLIVLVFSFTACNTPKIVTEITTTQTETTIPETPVITTETTVKVTETTDNTELKESTYIAEALILSGMITTAMEKGSKAAFGFANGEITMAEHKILAAQNIEDTNEFYDFYLNLKPPDRFKPSYEQLGEAMKHFLNSSIYMQQYIDSENMDEMVTCIGNATTELQLGTAYVKKATDEVNKLK